MNGGALAEVCPQLYHMAHDGAWPSIQDHGLLSTTALLDLFEVAEPQRSFIESQHRPEYVALTHPVHGQAFVRDQKPMSDAALEKCLEDGLSPADWYRLLNGRVFFWATTERLIKMVGAKAYRDEAQTVLTVDTAALVERHEGDIEVAVMNTGNTVPRAFPRGLGTFIALKAFDYEASRCKRGPRRAIAEIVVPYAVPDVASLVLRAERYIGGEAVETLFAR